jgi:outer membrane protein insertion porin family
MFNVIKNCLKYSILLILFFFKTTISLSDIVKEIKILGNDRISDETILVFSNISENQNIDDTEINKILKNLYETNFFKDVKVEYRDSILNIQVTENPLVYNIKFGGLKSKNLQKIILENIQLKERSSFIKTLIIEDKNKINSILRNTGYFFSKVEILKEDVGDNKLNLTIDIELGKKAKIKKISFIGDKIFKNRKLYNIIVSEEYKFWKFLSGKKYLNENTINLDSRLLKNFYLNNGYYNVAINSSFARLINNDEFELIYNINSNEKVFFGNLSLTLPDDYDNKNFKKINDLFNDLKNTHYSINKIDMILDEIDSVVLDEQYESVEAIVDEELVDNQLNLKFIVNETEKIFVEKINIFGNNITSENVIRNQLLIDEGDPFNKILQAKSINNIKSLNFFRDVQSQIISNDVDNTKIINISVQEKPTGEIMAGAGFGTSGTSFLLGVKENNFLGQGISLDSKLNLGTDSIDGQISVNNPNYKNSDKSINFALMSSEEDRLTTSGYKTNKTGFSLGTRFEYYDDFFLNIGASTFYEELDTDSTASALQKTQEGNYFDTFLKLSFNYDKRNQKFQTSKGFKSFYSIDLPLVSETNSLVNSYNYRYYTELYENNISSFSFLFEAANSINNKNIKLSERLYIPANSLRGFELGKVGPKDGEDYIGGNFISSINFSSTLPQILPNYQNADFLFFLDIANIWGVDYDSSLNDDDIRSSIGVGVDWFTPIGPLNFSLAQPLSKSNNDKTESFRFNLGTTF